MRDPEALRNSFSYHPSYYHFDGTDEVPVNFYEYGLQNSRDFRALKVWLGLRQAGRDGFVTMMSSDIALARALHRSVEACPELEAWTQELSITTFRYVPTDLATGAEAVESYLNLLNAGILTRMQEGGEAFLSNAVVREAFLLRACVVNFRTTLADTEAIPGIVVRIGAELDARLRPASLRSGV